MAERTTPAEPLPILEPKRTPDGNIDHSFLPFGETVIHLQWMPRLIEEGVIGIRPGQTVLFLGAGPVEPEVFWNALPQEVRSTLEIVITEPDPMGMEQTKERLSLLGGNFSYMLADADEALESGEKYDWIFFDAAIHLLPKNQRPEVMGKIHRSLADDGRAVIVSTFIKNWYRRGEVRLYADWISRTDDIIREEDLEFFEIVQRAKKDSSSPIKEMSSSKEYLEMFHDEGFEEVFFDHDSPSVLMRVSYEGFFFIAQYEEWINGSHPVRARGEEIRDQEYTLRMDRVTLYQQRAIAEVFPQYKAYGEVSERNQMVAILKKAA